MNNNSNSVLSQEDAIDVSKIVTINEKEACENEIKNTKFSVQGHLFVVNSVNHNELSISGLSSRGAVREFTVSSGARMRKYLRTCVANYDTFITLTYPHNYERDGRKSKEQLRRFIQELKRRADRDGRDMSKWGVFWFMEFQERGAIHYHLFTTDGVCRKWLSSKWYDICGTEDVRHLAAGTNIEKIKSGRHGTCAYASKYAAKSSQKVVPEDIKSAGRFWGVSGERRTVSADIVLTPETRELRTVKRLLNILKEEINDALAAGYAYYIVKSSHVMVLYMNQMAIQAKVVQIVRKIERVASIYQVMPGICLLPEYEIRESFEEGEDIDYDISLL